MAKNLILYYSRKGENYWGGKIVNLKKGNTERVAEFIQNAVGGYLFEVDTVKTYPADYHKCTAEAQAALRAGERVEPKAYLDNLADYDTIFVGVPQLVGDDAHGAAHLLGALRPNRQDCNPILHQRGQRHGFQRNRPAEDLQGGHSQARPLHPWL